MFLHSRLLHLLLSKLFVAFESSEDMKVVISIMSTPLQGSGHSAKIDSL